MKTVKAMIFDIERSSFVDGPGIRTTVFFKGCSLRCKWCHSPESRSRERQILFYRDKCSGCGRCRGLTVNDTDFICTSGAKEICGREYTSDEVLDIIFKDKVFYDCSGGGVTFSGGECLLQAGFLAALLEKCKACGISTAVDTAGCVPWESFEMVLPYTDLFLYDFKCFTEELHVRGTGVSNGLILDNLTRLSEIRGDGITVRIPVVPGFNDSEEELYKMASFLKRIRYKSVELLPYHAMGRFKYEALGEEFTEYGIPSAEEMERIRRMISILFCNQRENMRY